MKDLTKGNPAKVIIMFAIPLMMGNILQQLYNMTDSKIVSMYIGTDALGAVGATSVVSNTLIGFVNGLTQGFAIMIAKSFGAKDSKSLKKNIAGTMILTLCFTLALTILGRVYIGPILKVLETPELFMRDAINYVSIIIMGMIFVSCYNMCSNILRAVGDSKIPLICLFISVVLNIGFDLLFICVFHLGIKGAAYATILAQAISALSSGAFLLFRYKEIIPKKDEWKVESGYYSELIPAGISMGLMGCIVNIGTVALQKSINALGDKIVTAHHAGRRVFDILMVIIYTIGFSMTSFVSQNIGAGKGDRVRQGIKSALIIDSVLTVLLIGFTYLFGASTVKWVASTDNDTILSNGYMYIRIGVPFFFVLGPLFILRCSLQGMGHRIVPLVSSGLELITKIVFAFVLVPKLKYLGVCLTEPVSWIIMTVPLIIVYLLSKKELQELSAKQVEI